VWLKCETEPLSSNPSTTKKEEKKKGISQYLFFTLSYLLFVLAVITASHMWCSTLWGAVCGRVAGAHS
jgi:hypothetical protein